MQPTPEEEKKVKEIVNQVISGKDQWVTVNVHDHYVVTTTIFIKRFHEHLSDWVKEFLASSNNKIHEYSNHTVVDENDLWEKEFGDETIMQMMTIKPDNTPIVIIETYNRLIELKVIKKTIPEGQSKGQIPKGLI